MSDLNSTRTLFDEVKMARGRSENWRKRRLGSQAMRRRGCRFATQASGGTNAAATPQASPDGKDWPAVEQALARSVVYGALSLALHAPTVDTCARLLSPATAAVLRQAAFLLSESPSYRAAGAAGAGSEVIEAWVNGWIEMFPRQSLDGLAASQGRLFGHTPRGAVCPYESEYGAEALFQQPRMLAEIQGFYAAFGLGVSSIEKERADHVSCELEFLEFLSRKEALALQSGDSVMLEETRRAIRLFLKDHLGRFGVAFARRLAEQDPSGFFGRVADLLACFVARECRRLDVEPGPPLLHLRSTDEDRTPMACGAAEDSTLVQLEIPQ